jgi:transposase
MTLLPPGVKVHLAFGYIDVRKSIDGLAMLVQGVLRQDPFSGHLFVFRGRKANLLMQSGALERDEVRLIQFGIPKSGRL